MNDDNLTWRMVYYKGELEEAVKYRYDGLKREIGNKLFDILLKQRLPCVVDIIEENERYFDNPNDDRMYVIHTIKLTLRPVDRMNVTMYDLPWDSTYFHDEVKKSFWEKLKFWKRA